jgi:tetratricopeptide (TPR) repeat protein
MRWLHANHFDSTWQRITIRIKGAHGRPGNPSSGEMMRKQNSRTPQIDRRGFALIPSWKHAALFALATALSALPSHAQQKVRAEIGPNGGPNCGDSGACTIVTGDVPPLMKPSIPDDEKCLPWNLSAAPATAWSVTARKVPSKARSEYEKACNSAHKQQFEDAERYSRRAIDKFQDYAAAWVMLGVVLDEQHKEQEARDACSQATTIDGKYLPGYLCMAEFSARNREWEKLLSLANTALGLNSENAGYAYYYRAMAYLYLHKPGDAQKSAQEAAEIDVNHNYLPLYLLFAQIYDAEGDKVAAATQLRQVLKHHLARQQEDAVKQYLAELEAKQLTAPAEKSGLSEKNPAGEALPDEPNDWTILTMADLRRVNGSWIPEDIDDAVPPVASGVACSLPVVLDGAGQRIVELVHNVDRFTATESLTHEAIDGSGRMGSPITAQFNYLVSYTEDRTGYLQVGEFRNGSLSLEPFPSHVATIGTPSLVLIFHPLNVNNFRMECEGLGQWHGEPAWQVRFEQRADRPNLTYSFTVDRVTYNVNLRGRAWILADSFQVARLETDLEESIPKIRLRLDHQRVEYRAVESSTNHLQLWLPSSTELYMDFLGRRFYRKHSFTDFKLFSSTRNIRFPTPTGPIQPADLRKGPPVTTRVTPDDGPIGSHLRGVIGNWARRSNFATISGRLCVG